MQKIKIKPSDKAYRFLWNLTYMLLFKYSPIFCFQWRVLLLKVFGANVEWSSKVYPKCIVWSPRNLILLDSSCIANDVVIYNVEMVKVGKNSVISQRSELCTASKNYSKNRELIAEGISCGDNCWIASNVFVGPGVEIGDGSVVLARVNLFKSIKAGTKVKIRDVNDYIKIL